MLGLVKPIVFILVAGLTALSYNTTHDSNSAIFGLLMAVVMAILTDKRVSLETKEKSVRETWTQVFWVLASAIFTLLFFLMSANPMVLSILLIGLVMEVITVALS